MTLDGNPSKSDSLVSERHHLVRKVRARKVVAACICGWEVGVQQAFDTVEDAYEAHLWALRSQEKAEEQFFEVQHLYDSPDPENRQEVGHYVALELTKEQVGQLLSQGWLRLDKKGLSADIRMSS